ncbi:periodic tryptophan protein 1 homolog [Pectinophora gossypiella]|uniref:periodic tryptophan protein 1 homolog n=1 Tax=Pectinophora gossypiella TaxID=13191 RepID=UPI00214EEF50|nr:periodic tryptophan protein 1 homolog [Pectinophora gossypiella]
MEENSPTVSLISCMHFVRRGVAKSVPEKIELTEKELESIIKQTAEDLRLTENPEDSEDEEGEAGASAVRDPPANPNDEFDFEKYDEEDASVNPIGIGSVATLPNLGDLSENVQIRTEGPDSDEEDDIIKPDDNLLLVGHVESDASILEVYIFNKEEGSFYVHHDVILPWFPLCIEWLSHDPSDPNPGNLCALGGMDPVIQVWDLDIENCLEPAFKLGKKPNKKKKIKRVGHKDAVLDLSWNRNFTHVLASGSADNTVLLWDLDQGAPHTTLSYFEDKVQSLTFHPLEAQTLLSGSCDGRARVTDCRTPDAHRAWQLAGEIERVTWDKQNPFCFAMSNNEGKVSYVDCRQDEPLWTITAHEKEVTGLILSEQVPGLMVTISTDGKQKTWDISSAPPVQVSERSGRVGQALCAASCPDAPFSIAVGGDNKECCIEMVDLTINEQFVHRFGSRPLVQVTTESNDDAMES